MYQMTSLALTTYSDIIETPLDINSLIKYDTNTGEGYINILNATELVKDYNLYSTVMLWILNELYDKLPEVGDLARPKLVFFIDEAHMLFDEMSSNMLKKVTQIIKLIRSKGVGVYFISQSPSDIPEEISAQLGNRIQHNLKAYTPLELRKVDAAAQSFRANPDIDTKKAILELSTGEALVSFINEYGQPEIVNRAYILPPQGKIGVAEESTIKNIINSNSVNSIYKDFIDVRSAYEILEEKSKQTSNIKEPEAKTSTKTKSRTDKTIDRAVNSAASTLGRKIGNQIFKGLFK